MALPATNPRIVQFGLFELDLDARELRKSGVRIKLQDQPFQILSILLERPGTVITREELQNKLWPGDTFVDFDLSLNSAVKKLRQALSDDSENPRFVETLYRRGYRFIAPVNGAAHTNESHAKGIAKESLTEEEIHLAERTSSPASTRSESAPLQREPSPRARTRSGRTLLFLYGAVTFLSVLLAALIVYPLIPSQPPRVLGFTQITHDGHHKGDISSDGGRLYFTEMQGEQFVVSQVSVAGGETSTLPTPFENTVLGGISPDGATLAVGSFQGTKYELETWFLPLPSGPPRRIGDLCPDSIVWSPDGSRIVFSMGAEIFVAKSDLSEHWKLATATKPVSGLRFSPDGRKLRFELVEPTNGSSSIWEMASDGTGLRPLLPGWSGDPRECCGNWTPDGKYFLFQSFRNGRNSIWALSGKSRTAKPVQLTNGPFDFEYPLVSKDGKRIFAVGSQPRAELVHYDGSGFSPYLDGKSIRDLSFSADGKWVAYVSIPELQLWRSRVDGSERLQLSPDGMMAGLPRWSPDGKQLAFMSRNSKTDWLAYIVSSDGSGLRELIPGATAGYDPTWSSDGKFIALALNPAGSPKLPPEGPGIAIYNLQTGKISSLPDARQMFSPRWSPDGRYIAAITNDSMKLMLFDLATQQWQELANLPIGYPSWSHDGRYIYFDTILTHDPAFFRVRISDHKLERLFSLKGLPQYWGAFGNWTGLAPDDLPLFTRDTSSQEIYALDWEAP